jgi:cytochrome b
MIAPPPGDRTVRVLVWDLPTRTFHWSLAISFFTALATSDFDRLRDLHVCFGYIALGLIVFRILWGFAGTRYARFSSFTFPIRAAIRYMQDVLRGKAERYIGHNPPGSWAIHVMLTLGLVVCLTGVVVLGAEEEQGILRGVAERPIGELIKSLHESLSWVMFALVVTHVVGVVVESRAHHENLAGAMLTGRKLAPETEGITASHRVVAILMAIAMIVAATWFLRWRVMEAAGVRHLPFVGRALPDNETWRATCGTCHVPYHPTLLPARSWNAVLDHVHDHFGQDLAIDATTVREIREFMATHSAETGVTEAAYKINRSIPLHDTPRRITETGYWVEKHRDIDESSWGNAAVGRKNNCAGCHLDAHEGTYEDAAMRLPQ